MVRKHIYFSGTVQGVGFRYRVKQYAMELGLTGWVANLWDGRVEMEVQGEEKLIMALVQRMYAERYVQITGIESEDISVVQGEKRFRTAG